MDIEIFQFESDNSGSPCWVYGAFYDGLFYYTPDTGVIVNITHQDPREVNDLMDINDIECITSNDPICSIDDFIALIK